MIQKYRAWDTKNNEMFKDTFAITEGGEVVVVEQEFVTWAPDYVFVDHLVIMQSTGLHDKNGKEIFDGDIVTDGDVTSDIKYHQTLGFYMIGKYGFSVPFGQGVDVEYFEEFADHVSKTFEVVGNIYENPELLEVE
jgi:uncharacterized phage protein (TIGR01671 family)